MPAKQEGPGSLRSTVFFLTMWCFTQQRNRKIKPLSRGQSISSISSIGDKLEPLLMAARWDSGSLNRTAPEEKGLWSTLGSSALTELYVGQSLDDQSCCFKKFPLLENWVCMPDSKVSVSELQRHPHPMWFHLKIGWFFIYSFSSQILILRSFCVLCKCLCAWGCWEPANSVRHLQVAAAPVSHTRKTNPRVSVLRSHWDTEQNVGTTANLSLE